MPNLRVVSADSHMMEPADLWVTRLDNKFKDRAPKVIKNPDKPGYLFVAEGLKPFPVAGGFGAGRSGEELKDHMSKGYEAARPSGWDPVERVKDQDIDGVEAEVLYTTLGMPLFRIEDADLQRACFATYNDWVAEFSSHNPKRLYAIGLISLADIDEGVKELERSHKQGLRGAMIWGSPPEDKPYNSRIYDKFWQAASELHMPLSLHVITGKGKESEVSEREQISLFYMNVIHEVQRSLSTLIFGGVLE
ncbi:MAG: amidohydrolase family protein, partial [Deltaproteobacteria bacterium]|nr:amidohydrolase family protein [Deltaproteobacteria bacterium]